MQAKPAVRAEDPDALGEVIERLALHMDQRIVAAFERQPLGDVLIDPGHAALRVGVGDDAQCLLVRQVPPMLARLGRAVSREQIGPPGLEVDLFRQLALAAQAVEHGILVGPLIEECRVEIEEAAIGLVV